MQNNGTSSLDAKTLAAINTTIRTYTQKIENINEAIEKLQEVVNSSEQMMVTTSKVGTDMQNIIIDGQCVDKGKMGELNKKCSEVISNSEALILKCKQKKKEIERQIEELNNLKKT